MRVVLFLFTASLAPWVQAEELAARTLRVYDSSDADQGVAVDRNYFFAVDNWVIAKHSRATGELVARWDGGERGPIQHMNSCIVLENILECAHSNYPATPMASSIEMFDSKTMTHVGSHSFGLTDEGSITWTDTIDGGRVAGFAHYAENGGEPFKDNSYGAVVTYDTEWRRTGGYAFPPEISLRMAPHAASGGAIGPDGLLYVLGHDRPEMYALAKPRMGPYLIHLATIVLAAEGQAFSFESRGNRNVWVIDRRQGKVRQIELPPVRGYDESGVFRSGKP